MLENIMLPWKTQKLESIQRESIKIYTGVFKTTPLETLYIKAIELPLDLRIKMMGLMHLYKLKSNPTYTEFIVSLCEEEDHINDGNKKAIRPRGINLKGWNGGTWRNLERQKKKHLV